MRDSFAREARAFIAQYDRLRLDERASMNDLPQKSSVRPLLAQAEALSVQRSNPFRDATIRDLLAIDLADAFLRWASDFTVPQRWSDLFVARESLREAEGNGSG